MKESLNADIKQNNFLDELRKKREKILEAYRENDFEDGIKNLLTDLYPDNAHFIYELLQNAEDARATEVQILLEKDKATFEHNGNRLFSQEDVVAITGIGKSPKKDDHTSIGKFGIGFKAVFAYTETPEIKSGEFHFRIRDMFVPDTKDLFPAIPEEGNTLFTFPFNNPKKSPENAQVEIKRNLQELNENSLLFLSNIRRIDYCLPDSTKGYLELRKNENDEHQIEISIVHPGNPVPDSSHFLRFEKVVSVRDEENDELKDYKIAVAFGMEKTEKGEWKIRPLNPGQVCIYFPAVDEKSNLQFHMHAPFASTVARNSVRDCPANDELRDHLAVLIAESMHTIRERDMLDVEFLSILPNGRRYLYPFYLPIQKQLIKEFNAEKLVPMKQGEHAAASGAYRGARALSDLIDDDDLATLLGKDHHSPLWVANPPLIRRRDDKGRFIEDENAKKQNERINDFLDTLDILEWGVEDLIEALNSGAEPIMKWLQNKGDEWYQKFYAFLDDAPSDYEDELSELRIVRCIDGEYRIGSECHFFTDDVKPDENLFTGSTLVDDADEAESQKEETQEEDFHYVDPAVYSFGNNKNQQEKARKFLETIKVNEVDETERVKVILKQRYREPFNPRDEDMKKFIELVEEVPTSKSIFDNYSIFEIDLKRDNKRSFRKPGEVFLDSPYLDTSLTAYHDAISKDSDSFKQALSPNYANHGSNIDPKDLAAFAEAVGVQTKLEIIPQNIPSKHPERSYLIDHAEGQLRYDTRKNEDHTIPEIRILLDSPSIEKSRLIWRTMCSQTQDCLYARYRNNASYPIRVGSSSLVHTLRNAKWVPQRDDGTIFFVRPCLASIERLPEGFPYETEQEWLKAIEFGKKTKEQQEEHAQRNQQAKDFGFASIEEAEKFAELGQMLNDGEGITVEVLISQYKSQNRQNGPGFPTSPVRNPELREKRVLEQIRNAPHKIYEERIRNERVTKFEINQRETLQQWYTNHDSDAKEMVCQICKEEMPFKKTDGKYYFVAMEALTIKFKSDELPEYHFPKEFVAQYLALCPECAARFDYFVRTVKEGKTVMEKLRNHIINSEDMEFPLKLGELETSIRFVETHFHDLKEILRYYENSDEVEDSTD